MNIIKPTRYVDIGKQRFSKGKHYYITQSEPIDVVKGKKQFIRRVNAFQFYAALFRARIKEGLE